MEITNQNLGYVPSTPSEFKRLCRMIEQKTGRSISLSSIKRIWGYVRYEGFPSVTTLNNLAQYNEFSDWGSFLTNHSIKNSDENSGFIEGSLLTTDNLRPGDRLMLDWGYGKSCEIECIAHMRFRINASHNIKLEPGDTFTLHTLCVGHPIYISDIERGASRMSTYIGAKKGGLSSITLIPAGC